MISAMILKTLKASSKGNVALNVRPLEMVAM